MRCLLGLAALIGAAPAAADYLVPLRTIRPAEIIGPADLSLKNGEIAGAIAEFSDIVGLEARVALYPGRPVLSGDVGPPAVVGRNDAITLIFRKGELTISTEGRSLGRGAVGDTIRALNIASRVTVTGRIRPDGSVEVE